MFERLKAAAKGFFNPRLAALNVPQGAAQLHGDLTGIINSLPISHLRDYDSYLWAGSRKVWASWKSCDLCAKQITNLPRGIFKDGAGDDPIFHKELTPLLTVANPHETMSELLTKIIFHLKLTGNAFIAKDQCDLMGNRPKYLYAMNPRRVILALDRNSEVGGFTYVVGNGHVIPFDVQEVVHIKMAHPDRDYWGLGEVESAEPTFNEFINRQTWTEKFWENGASMSGILYQKDQDRQTDVQAWEEAKRKFYKEYHGANNSGKTAWLSGDWGYLKMGLTAQEMQSIEKETWTVEQIFHQHGIPLTVAGIEKAANRATAEVDDIRFLKYTIVPLCKLIEERMNLSIVHGFDPSLNWRFSIQGLVDIEKISQALPLLFGCGIFSINEGRVLMGLPEIDDPLYDQHFLNAGLVPLETAGFSALDQTNQQAQEIIKRFVQGMMEPKIKNGHEPDIRPKDRAYRRQTA